MEGSMKLRHPGLIKLIGMVVGFTVRRLMNTIRTREYLTDPLVLPNHRLNTKRYIYAFWHEGIMYLAGRYGVHKNIAILISRHADGELISQACHWLGIKTVRGSTAKAGALALYQMLEKSHVGHLAITPDGPRGPRREVQLGTIFLASRTGFPIVPIGVYYHRAWYARSWDKMGIPLPFSRAAGITGEPLIVPPNLTREQLEEYAQELKRRMMQATDQAENWVKTRTW
jgi:lysophospholipid acyltransferase (LPLAT)-like uncharacterized protein